MPFGEIVLVMLVFFFPAKKDLKFCFFGFGDIDFVICDFFFSVKKKDFVVIFVSGKKREKRVFFLLLLIVCFGEILFVVMCFY